MTTHGITPSSGMGMGGTEALSNTGTLQGEKTLDATLKVAQQISNQDNSKINEEEANPITFTEKKIRAQDKTEKTQKRTDVKDSAFVRIEEKDAHDAFTNFKKRDDNQYVRLPQEEFERLGVDIQQNPAFAGKDGGTQLLAHIEKTLEDHHPIVIARAFDYLIFLLEGKIAKETDTYKAGTLDSKLQNVLVAKEVFMARDGVKNSIDLDTADLRASANAVKIEEKALLSKGANSIIDGVNEIILVEKDDTKPGAAERLSEKIYSYVENRVPNSTKSTVVKQFDVLSEITQKKYDASTSPEEKAELEAFDKTLQAAKESFKMEFKEDLDKEKETVGSQKTILAQMQKMVLQDPDETVQDYFHNHSNDLHETTIPIIHFIGEAVKQEDLENPKMAKIMQVCKKVQAVVNAGKHIKKLVETHTRRQIQNKILTAA